MYPRKSASATAGEEALRCEVERRHQLRLRYGLFLGRIANDVGVRKAARRAGVSPQVASYWKQKVVNPGFHPRTWGGTRNNAMAFGSFTNDLAVQHVVFEAILDDPDVSFRGLLLKLRSVPGLEAMSAWWLSTTIRSWGWNWATTRTVARNKYTDENMRLWVEYAIAVLDIPMDRVSGEW